MFESLFCHDEDDDRWRMRHMAQRTQIWRYAARGARGGGRTRPRLATCVGRGAAGAWRRFGIAIGIAIGDMSVLSVVSEVVTVGHTLSTLHLQ